MSDVKGIEISDLLGLSQPLTKLVETVSCGIGKIYEPVHIRRVAKAKAEEINEISNSMTANYEYPIEFSDGKVTMSSAGEGLLKRAQNRFLFQEMKKQQNIEMTIDNAYSILQTKEMVSNEPVNVDWISSFFNFVANVSDEQMQILWGKLLAGEIENPGSVSIRTLDALRKLTHEEASVFQKMAPFVLHCIGDESGLFDDFFLINEEKSKNILAIYNIKFADILNLSDAGILSDNEWISIGFSLNPGESEYVYGCRKKIKITNNDDNKVKFTLGAYLLTNIGRELYKTVYRETDFKKEDSKIEEYINCIVSEGRFSSSQEKIRIEII